MSRRSVLNAMFTLLGNKKGYFDNNSIIKFNKLSFEDENKIWEKIRPVYSRP
jgi:hypothetical protein